MSLSEQLGIKHPILLAPMAGVSTPLLAAEVSNQGALGALGLGANTLDSALQQIQETQALTPHPFQLNFFCHESTALNTESNTLWSQHLAAELKNLAQIHPHN